MTIGIPKPPPKLEKPRKGIPRKTAPKKRNPARQKRRFETDFGGAEYLAFIRSLPCAICGVRGFTVAAHLTSRGAGGRAEDVAPLCDRHVVRRVGNYGFGAYTVNGCHERYDAHDPEIRKHEPRLRKLAAELRASHLSGERV